MEASTAKVNTACATRHWRIRFLRKAWRGITLTSLIVTMGHAIAAGSDASTQTAPHQFKAPSEPPGVVAPNLEQPEKKPSTNEPPSKSAIPRHSSTNAEPPVLTNLPELSNDYLKTKQPNHTERLKHYQFQLELARKLRDSKQTDQAAQVLAAILDSDATDDIKRTALLEMAYMAQQLNDLQKAQHIFGMYIHKYPEDPAVPEILLRQGLLYRQMGATTLALSKFYSVMTTSLHLKLDQMHYYQRLVLQAQTEIAETYYLQGNYESSVDFLKRLLKLDNPDLNREQTHFKLIRSLVGLARDTEIEAQARDFIQRYPNSRELPEVRFICASTLKRLNRNDEALQQVLLLLQAQQAVAQKDPENWFYWQQRTGNEIANQLYKEGDFVHALEIYSSLAQLSSAATWQIPVQYQIGLIYERLRQPEKARETYAMIGERAKSLSEDGSPGLKALIDMAKWRMNFLSWQNRTDQTIHELNPLPPAAISALPEETFPAVPAIQ